MSTIYYDKEKRQDIIYTLNDIIENLNIVNNNLYNTFVPKDYYYYNSLNNLKNSLKYTKRDLDNYKKKLNIIIDKINKDELDILSKANKIEEIFIERF